MKIRFGFVSNSSSASFVLHTDLSMEKFKELLSDLPEYFGEENFKKEVNSLISKEEAWIRSLEGKGDPGAIHNFWIDQTRSNISRWEKLRDLNESGMDLIDAVLDFHNYSLEENQMKKASVRGHTSMYNDESDLGGLLLAIRDMLEERCGHSSWMLEVFEEG